MDCIFRCSICGTQIRWDNARENEPVCHSCGKGFADAGAPSVSQNAGPVSSGQVGTGVFSACPRCGETSPFYTSSAYLTVFRCACGTTYCDRCSGGGLVDLPRCPTSVYHEGITKAGVVVLGGSNELLQEPKKPGAVTPWEAFEIEAPSYDEARQQLKETLEGWRDPLIRVANLEGDAVEMTKAMGDTLAEALESAEAKVPAGSRIEKRDVSEPHTFTTDVAACDEVRARSLLVFQNGQRLLQLAHVSPARKGFLGIGNRLGSFRATILQQAIVTLTHRSRVVVRFEVLELPSPLRHADLKQADLQRADLSGRDLSFADLTHANLRSANLRRANLGGAILRSANLTKADLTQANLQDADLSGASFVGATFAYATGGPGTRYPRGFVPSVEQIKGAETTVRWKDWNKA